MTGYQDAAFGRANLNLSKMVNAIHPISLGGCGHLVNLGLHRARALRCIRSRRFPGVVG